MGVITSTVATRVSVAPALFALGAVAQPRSARGGPPSLAGFSTGAPTEEDELLLDEIAERKSTGLIYEQLFIRHCLIRLGKGARQ